MAKSITIHKCKHCGEWGCYDAEHCGTVRCESCQKLFDKEVAESQQVSVKVLAAMVLPQKWDTNGGKTLVYDFNGVIDLYQGWKGHGYHWPINPDAGLFMAEMKRLGYRNVIQTAANLNDVTLQLDNAKLTEYVSLVTSRKVPAIAYLDDRAILFNGKFDSKLVERIVNFRTWWENGEYHEAKGPLNGQTAEAQQAVQGAAD